MKTKNCLLAILLLSFSLNGFVNAAEVDLERLKELEDKISKAEKKSSLKRNIAIASAVGLNLALFGSGIYVYNKKYNELDNKLTAEKFELDLYIDILNKFTDSLKELAPYLDQADLELLKTKTDLELLKTKYFVTFLSKTKDKLKHFSIENAELKKQIAELINSKELNSATEIEDGDSTAE